MLASFDAQRRVPVRTADIAHHAPVVVRYAIAPQRRATLALNALVRIDNLPGQLFGVQVFGVQCFAHFPAYPHQLGDELGALGLRQVRIDHAPKPAAYREITAIGRDRVERGCKG